MMSGPQQEIPSTRGWIGLAKADITPELDVVAKNWGASRHEKMSGVHRPLTVVALSLRADRDARPQVLLSLTLGWWRNREDEQEFRHALLRELDLPESHLLLHLSHTHAGPVLASRLGTRPLPENQRYLQSLRERCLSAARQAIDTAEPGWIRWAQGSCALATNRDLRDPAAGERFVCGYNPETVTDSTLWVGQAMNEAGQPLGTVVNYACHPTTLGPDNGLFSPDYIGAMQEMVEASASGQPCLFLLGACGELAPAEQYGADPAVADRHGRVLGHAVLSVLESLGPWPQAGLHYEGVLESGAPLGVWKPFPLAEGTAKEIRVSGGAVEFSLKSNETQLVPDEAALEPFARERWQRARDVRSMFGSATVTHESIWVWQWGDALICAHPFEAYSDLQLQLRAMQPGRPVLVANITNGWRGYLPPLALSGEDLYAATQTPFAADGLERLTEAFRHHITPLVL